MPLQFFCRLTHEHNITENTITVQCSIHFLSCAILAFEALVISASVEGEWVKYRIDVKRIIKKSNRNFRKGEQMLIVKLAYIQRCKCSKLKLSSGRKYLIFSSHNKPLILEPNDSVVTWRDSYKPMLNRYSKPKKKCQSTTGFEGI